MDRNIRMVKGIVTDIQRFSVHDGIGIRTLVFIKGCPLHCRWCHNPETNSRTRQLMVYPDKCISCGECMKICPLECIRPDGTVERTVCNICGKCTLVCCTGSKCICGEEITAGEVIDRVNTDKVFFVRSNGGITLSGGEPTASPEFALAILQLAKESGINTAIETSGYCPSQAFEQFFKWTDMFLFDIKHTDPEKHKAGTGVDNRLILNNLFHAAKNNQKIVIRYPMIPGFNDDDLNLKRTAQIAGQIHAVEIHVLPFHQLGAEKWRSLDKEYTYADKIAPEDANIRHAVSVLETSGCSVNVNGYGEYAL